MIWNFYVGFNSTPIKLLLYVWNFSDFIAVFWKVLFNTAEKNSFMHQQGGFCSFISAAIKDHQQDGVLYIRS